MDESSGFTKTTLRLQHVFMSQENSSLQLRSAYSLAYSSVPIQEKAEVKNYGLTNLSTTKPYSYGNNVKVSRLRNDCLD
jgi:hypothetical protein